MLLNERFYYTQRGVLVTRFPVNTGAVLPSGLVNNLHECPSNFLGNRTKTPTVGEVAVDLAVPGGVFALPDEGAEIRQFIGRELFNRGLYFSETHSGSVSRRRRKRNSSSPSSQIMLVFVDQNYT